MNKYWTNYEVLDHAITAVGAFVVENPITFFAEAPDRSTACLRAFRSVRFSLEATTVMHWRITARSREQT